MPINNQACDPSCAVDEPTAPDNVIHDEAAQVCYAAPAADSNGDAPALAVK